MSFTGSLFMDLVLWRKNLNPLKIGSVQEEREAKANCFAFVAPHGDPFMRSMSIGYAPYAQDDTKPQHPQSP